MIHSLLQLKNKRKTSEKLKIQCFFFVNFLFYFMFTFKNDFKKLE
jgi:hypothetical protein